jgi:hypothetical protein
MNDNGPPKEQIQERKILIEVAVVDAENLIFSRPDFILSAFLFDESCHWQCATCPALHAGTAFTFLLVDNEVSLAGAICPRCREHPYLRQLLVDLFSQAFPSIDFKLPMVAMPPGVQ